MAKRRDRAFHLTVTVFALTLAAISAITLLNQQHVQVIPRRFLPFQSTNRSTARPSQTAAHTTPPAKSGQGTNVKSSGSGANTTSPGQTASSTSPHPVADLVGKPVYHPADNAAMVVLTGYGSDMSQSQVQHTRDLMAKYQIASVVSHTLEMNLHDAVHIYLVQSAQDYEHALGSLFSISASQAKAFSADTGGFTQDESILIPMYQNQADTDLVNTLAHELTHAMLNDNIQADIPSWINEGLAVSDGMKIQQAAENGVEFAGDARTLAESVLQAESKGQLIALTADENQVLTGNAPYDLELQDWLAMNDLLKAHGQDALSDYLYRLSQGETAAVAFQRSFGESETTFNQSFTSLLETAVHASDPGVQLTFTIKPSFHGYLRLLQHGSHNWQGLAARAGQMAITMSPQGKLTGANENVQSTYDATKPDDHTLYINLDPDSSLVYEGKPVQDCGLALDYHNGLYAFVNGWVTWQNGKSTYFYTPSLFGVTLVNVHEENDQNPLLGLL